MPAPYHSQIERAQVVAIWNIHYNYHRPRTTRQDQPPADVTNLIRNYS